MLMRYLAMLKQSKLLAYSALVPILQTFQKIGIFDALEANLLVGMSSKDLAEKLSLKPDFAEQL